MPTLLKFLARAIFLAAGLLFAASLAIAFVLMLAAWTLRAAWARLTGRPVMPFVIRIDPRGGFDRMYRGRASARTAGRQDAQPRQPAGDVTDVEPRPPAS